MNTRHHHREALYRRTFIAVTVGLMVGYLVLVVPAGATAISANNPNIGISDDTDCVIVINSSTSAVQQQATTETANNSHTLVIIQKEGRTSYSLSVSGTLRAEQTESSDFQAGNEYNGHVGGLPWKPNQTDGKDVIHFTGTLENFEYNQDQGSIRMKLNGNSVDPDKVHKKFEVTPVPTPTQGSGTTTTEPPTAAQDSPTATQTTQPPQPTATQRSTPAADGSGSGDGFSISFILAIVGGAVLVVLWKIN